MDENQLLPIYSTLLNKVNTSPLEENLDWKRICSAINKLSDERQDLAIHLEIIYALILHHDRLEQQTRPLNRQKMNVIPYSGKTFDVGKPSDIGRGVMYVVSNLPPQLQQIIAQYIREIIVM